MTRSRTKVMAALGAVVVVALVAGLSLAFANRQYIQDVLAAQRYQPTADVQQVMNRLSLTPNADIIFRASAPTITASNSFSEQCADVMHKESDQVVGCFTGENIHLFGVTDERLDGMVEVTAAHELLHATFARLSGNEKRTITHELEKEYARLGAEYPRLVERMKVYEDLNSEAFVNELHSVLATEVDELSPLLETHYARYFENRRAIVDLFHSYDTYFAELESQRNALREQLTQLALDIEASNAAYESDLTNYNARAQDLTARNNRFEFSDDPSQFYAVRDQLLAQRASLEQRRSALNEMIATYNTLREQLLKLDATAQELIHSIDSRQAPPPPA